MEIINVFFPKLVEKNNDKHTVNYSEIKKENFLILSPKFICSFIMNELRLTREKQIYSFSDNFKSIATRFCKKFLTIFRQNILGIKISFTGK